MRGWRRAPALATLLLLTACDLLQPMPDAALPIDELDVEPRPADLELSQPATGPVMQIATGEVQGARFHFVVHASAGGVCTSVEWENGGGIGCGALPGDAPQSEAFGTMSIGGDGLTQDITGLVDAEVADVWIELDSGERGRAVLLPLDPAGLEANAFLAFVPVKAVPVAVVALDGNGDLIERFELGPGTPPMDGPVPTAAAP